MSDSIKYSAVQYSTVRDDIVLRVHCSCNFRVGELSARKLKLKKAGYLCGWGGGFRLFFVRGDSAASGQQAKRNKV